MPRASTSMGNQNYKGPRQPRNLRPFSIKQGRATLEAGPKKVVGHLGPKGEEEAAKLQPRIASRAQARGPSSVGQTRCDFELCSDDFFCAFQNVQLADCRLVAWVEAAAETVVPADLKVAGATWSTCGCCICCLGTLTTSNLPSTDSVMVMHLLSTHSSESTITDFPAASTPIQNSW